MTAVLIILLILCIAFFALLCYAGHRIETLLAQVALLRQDRSQGASAATLDATWDKVRSQVLRDAAEDWPRVDAEAERKRLSWVAVPAGQPESLVVRWLLLRADQIEGKVSDDDD